MRKDWPFPPRDEANAGLFTSGSKLRIVNTGMAVGARIMSSRTEASSPANSDSALTSRSIFFCFSDLGRHHEAIVRNGNPRENGAVAPKEQIETVTFIFSTYFSYEMHSST